MVREPALMWGPHWRIVLVEAEETPLMGGADRHLSKAATC